MKFIPFSEIKHLLPNNCWYKQDIPELPVLYCEGHQYWDAPLDLDEVVNEEHPSEIIPFILVNGNLTVPQIYNEHVDGSTGLVVLGNLKTNNIVVGGQEIYVKGDLDVAEVFWGEHDHGNLVVEGTIRSRLFINTDYGVDDYRFSMRENIEVDFVLNHDLERDVADPTVLFHLIKPEYLYTREDLDDTIYSWQDWLKTADILRALAQNQSILLDTPNPAYADEAYPYAFPNKDITLDNVMKLAGGTIFNQNHIPDKEEINIEYTEGPMYKRISFFNGDPYSTTVYFQYEDLYAMLVTIEKKKSILPFSKDYTVQTFYKYPSEQGSTWQPMVNTSIAESLTIEWQKLLREYSDMIGIYNKKQKIVTAINFNEIMKRPIVQRLGKRYYESEDSTVFYCGQQWQFRLEDKAAGHAPRITIHNYLGKGADGENQYEYFHYELEQDSDPKSKPYVQIYYQREKGPEADVYLLEVCMRRNMLKAINYFIYLQKYIERVWIKEEVILTEEEIKLREAIDKGNNYLRGILGQR
ncbi:hypothetical protein HX052_05660 [Myroides marinus]|uniref:hypothetical protein n=1 Tax=Myroides marinus TaxID=703342 RepID=UPI00257643E5|nr:hypothetical protein [Myroides marinus]MDM1369879.1 hypothetical protein [Myroides marinus]MDM1372538.1 hypothetical protein [Myroides marinus]MDM1376804.1 hypothetical protein [Myroides marinus]MDM1384123.1 hypothetical protein [Myroides marinus]MDM1389456.1 hypothetical protein [Myroides marinus]